MRVYNLTDQILAFRKKTLAPNGGYEEFPELDGFIPDRDRELATKKVIAFRELPTWWKNQRALEKHRKIVPAQAPVAVEPSAVESSALTQVKAKK